MSSASTEPQTARHLLRHAAGGLAFAAALLGAVEGMARLAWGPPPPDVSRVAVSGVELAVGRDRVSLFHPDNPTQDRSFPLEKRRPRVAVLGGSSVHHDVRKGPEVNFPVWLQRSLPATEVLNLGAPGLTTQGVLDLVADLRSLPDGHLDLVVVYAGHNDFSEPLFRGRIAQPGRLLRALQGFLDRSWIHTRLRSPAEALLAPTRTDPHAARFTRDPRAAAWRAPTLARLEANLRGIVAQSPSPVILSTLVRSFGAPPVGVLLTDAHPRCADTVRGLPRQALREPALYADRVAAQCGPDRALEAWYRAHAAEQAGEPEAAAAHFAQMRRLDPLPLSAPSEADAVVERVATETGAGLWRTEQALGSLPAGAHFDDLLHPSAAGAQRLGEHLAGVVVSHLVAEGALPPGSRPAAGPGAQTGAEARARTPGPSR